MNGSPPAGSQEGTLSDVAMFYWNRDLRPDVPNALRPSSADPASWQHLSALVVGYGLNASIYTRDTRRGRELARRIHCGTVNVNEAFGATFASIDAPMGGMRESGMGRRQGAEGILRYTESQAVGTQRLLRFAPMFGMSDAQYAKFMTLNVKLMTKLGRK